MFRKRNCNAARRKLKREWLEDGSPALVTRSRVVVLAGVLGALLIAALVLAVRDRSEPSPAVEALPATFDAEGLRLTAARFDAGGIDPETGFTLSSEADLTAAQVRGALKVRPDVELSIDRKSAREFAVKPGKTLSEDTVYRFDFVSGGAVLANWAFQVQAPVRVVSTAPEPQRTNVPVNAGIEITFSHDGVSRPEDFVEITPKLEGHFEQHKRTLVFVPRELQSYTLYTVRVKAGVVVEGSDLKLADDYVFQFETGATVRGVLPPSPPLSFLSRMNSASTREAPVLSLASNLTSETSIDVYAYSDLASFLADLDRLEAIPPWANWALAGFQADPNRLARVATVTVRPESNSSPQFPGLGSAPYARFPEPLPQGFYLLRVEGPGTSSAQAWLQVTDIAAYVALGTKDTLVWVNDIEAGGPVSGANVDRPGKGRLGSTGADGTARFDTPAEALTQQDPRTGSGTTGRGYFVIGDSRGRQHVAPLSPVLYKKGRYYASDYYYESPGGDYWALLSTDRPVYKPSDTIHFWGVARPREGKPEMDVKLVIAGGYDAYGGRTELAASKTLTTSSMGTFEGDLSFETLAVGSYQMELRHGDQRIWSSYFTVDTYTKPAYKMTASTDRIAYIDGDPVRMDIAAGFFEGTPVAGLQLNAGTPSQPQDQRGVVTTGLDGKATYDFNATLRPNQISSFAESSYAQTFVEALPVRPEEAQISASAIIAIFPSQVGLRVATKYESGVITLSGSAYGIDTARVKTWADMYQRPPGDPQGLPLYASGPAANQEVSIQVTEVRYNKVEIGETYDFISKIARKVYRYDRIEDHVETRTVRTGPDGRFTYTLPTAEDRTYQLDITSKDSAGRAGAVRTTAYSRLVQAGPSFLGSLVLKFREDTGFVGAPREFATGEDVPVTLVRSTGETLPAGGSNRYLFYEAQGGNLSPRVQDGPDLDFRFDEKRVPGVSLRAVYFNGSSYFEPGPEGSGSLTVKFNPQERRLNIELTPDKQSYGPGDEASVSVRVTDAAGKPVKAEVNLAVVDEALFAVRDFSPSQVDVLVRLYQNVPAGLVRTYASHATPQEAVLSAPRTGGGDDEPRINFQDLALSETVGTDAAGKSQVKFKLPDNLTSWRITALGMSADLKAGTGQGSLVVKRPFFADAGLNADYLAGDKPYLRVRAFGDELRTGDMVQFEVRAPSLGLAAPLTGQAAAFTGLDLALPPLVEGEHEITIKALAGGQSDALVRKITVLQSRLSVPEVRYVEQVRSGQDVQSGASGRSRVTFVDAGRGAYYTTLAQLADTRGDRADQAIARIVAGRLLTRYFDEPPRPEDFDPKIYTRPGNLESGGLSLLPFTSVDLILTARVAEVAPDVVGKNALRPLLQKVADDRNETAERQAIALYGLAALGDPVLTRLNALEGEPALGWRGRLYVGLGLQAAGDSDGARAAFEGLLSDFGEDIAPYWRLRAGADQDDIIEATVLAANLAAGIGDSRADALMRYARENGTRDIVTALDDLGFAQKRLSRVAAQPVSFSLTTAGQTTDVTLERGRSRSWSLTEAELKALRIDVREGELAASVSFRNAGSAPPPANPDLRIARSILPVEGSTLTQTGLVKVVIDFSISPQAPDGCYEVDDVLPSGLKPVTQFGALNLARAFEPNVVYPYRVEGQRVSFCLGKGSKSPVVYYARPSGKGTFLAEPAVFFNQRAPDVISSSGRTEITIQ